MRSSHAPAAEVTAKKLTGGWRFDAGLGGLLRSLEAGLDKVDDDGAAAPATAEPLARARWSPPSTIVTPAGGPRLSDCRWSGSTTAASPASVPPLDLLAQARAAPRATAPSGARTRMHAARGSVERGPPVGAQRAPSKFAPAAPVRRHRWRTASRSCCRCTCRRCARSSRAPPTQWRRSRRWRARCGARRRTPPRAPPRRPAPGAPHRAFSRRSAHAPR